MCSTVTVKKEKDSSLTQTECSNVTVKRVKFSLIPEGSSTMTIKKEVDSPQSSMEYSTVTVKRVRPSPISTSLESSTVTVKQERVSPPPAVCSTSTEERVSSSPIPQEISTVNVQNKGFFKSLDDCPVFAVKDAPKRIESVPDSLETGFNVQSTLPDFTGKNDDVPTYRYPCNVCNKVLGTSGKYMIHMRTHTNVKPFPCSFCSLSYVSMKKKKKHEKLVHGVVDKKYTRQSQGRF
ncbi:hypothetical protein ACF0H5_022887 [Mactra antiquata]